ncbi:hypothetical protein WJX81_004893 [Elliptochloris bilobata]|uniref:asparagine--tRNA ligase n=1 Tax=Elliptochloris bilobata TaxID=381761 RepID=A0AAW1RFU3_9CHLO
MADGAVDEVESLRQQVAELQLQLKAKNGAALAQSADGRDTVAPYSRSFQRTMVATVLSSPDEGVGLVGCTLRIGGWVRTGREAGAGAFAFLEVSDGSCFGNIQVMVTKEVAEAVGGLKAITSAGTSVLVEGELTETPPGTKQKVELKAMALLHVGPCDNSAGEYPLAKKKQTMEFLREIMHLRARTNTIGAVARVRNALAAATHAFFQGRGFLYVHTPVVTASDCEGAGEMFQVTTLLTKADEKPPAKPSAEAIAEKQAAVDDRVAEMDQLRADEAADSKVKGLAKKVKNSEVALQRVRDDLAKIMELTRVEGGILRTEDGKVDYRADFFGKPAFLTVSGQLNAEYYACALSNVYTFGPTFRAENSHTARHLAEFLMIEPEMAFCTLEDDMQCAEDYVRFCCRHLLDTCRLDLEFLGKQVDSGAIARLEAVADTPFKRLSYTEAVGILEEVVRSKKKKFEFPVKWGVDLQSEHERYLTEEVFQQPVIVYNYPRAIKAFYMRQNDDGRTVAAMDVLVPKVGELIGGSQREERLEVLKERLEEAGMPLEPYAAYLDLRKYGTVPHAGFGLGFERLVLFATGLENIREAIPFPRWPGHADF